MNDRELFFNRNTKYFFSTQARLTAPTSESQTKSEKEIKVYNSQINTTKKYSGTRHFTMSTSYKRVPTIAMHDYTIYNANSKCT